MPSTRSKEFHSFPQITRVPESECRATTCNVKLCFGKFRQRKEKRCATRKSQRADVHAQLALQVLCNSLLRERTARTYVAAIANTHTIIKLRTRAGVSTLTSMNMHVCCVTTEETPQGRSTEQQCDSTHTHLDESVSGNTTEHKEQNEEQEASSVSLCIVLCVCVCGV